MIHILHGDCRTVLPTLPAGTFQCCVTSPPYYGLEKSAILWYLSSMSLDTRIRAGQHLSRATEFKLGQHWRQTKPHWGKEWLVEEYVTKARSTGDVAKEIGTTGANVFYWLRKHGISRRTISEARAVKWWGLKGIDNPRFGKFGAESPSWKGGCTPDRQAFYASSEWRAVCVLVWRRDKASCCRCGHKQVQGKRGLDIHHIMSFSVKELRADPNNLVLLCRPCHRFVHSKANVAKEYKA